MKKVLLVLTSAVISLSHSRAQTLIAGWDFQTTNSGGTAILAAPNTPTLFNANFGSGTLYMNGSEGSSTWLPATELSAFTGTAVNASNGLSTTTTSPAALAPLGGTGNAANGKSAVFKFSLTGFQDLSLTYAAQRTSTGFTSQVWEWSTDGLTYNPIGTISSGTTAGTIASSFATSGVLGFSNITGLNNAATAYVRVTFSGATAASGNNRLDNFQFIASTFVPSSAAAAWYGDGVTAGGSGTWSTTSSNWSTNSGGAFQTWNPSEKAVFGTAGGNVIVGAGGVSANAGIDFTADGYLVGGDILTLGGSNNQISVTNNAAATLNNEIAGSSGFTKLGSGTLVLGGVNTFSGTVTVSAGTLQLTASDVSLGNATNDLILNGTLKTAGNASLGAGRDISGSATFDLGSGGSLTVNGGISNTATTLLSGSTLDLQGSVRTLGAVTLAVPATITGIGAITASSLNASAVTNGTVTIVPDLVFGAGDTAVSIGAGAAIDLNGSVSNGGGTGRIAKTGSGTLILGANNTGGLRVGAAGTTPTDGGTVVLESKVVGSQATAIQHNYGTLSAASDFTGANAIANGISIGGRTGAAALLAGNNIEFQGQSSFFRGTGTSGQLVMTVDNTTIFSGGFAATSGGGTATGITIGGAGTVVVGGVSSALTDAITMTGTSKLLVNNALGSTTVSINSGAAIGGNGTIAGALSLASGANFMVFDLTTPLAVTGAVTLDNTFSIASLLGADGNLIDWTTITDGTYTLISNASSFSNIQNFGSANKVSIGGDRFAYFSEGSLQLNVVPEPSTYALLALSALGLAGHVIRRRRR